VYFGYVVVSVMCILVCAMSVCHCVRTYIIYMCL